MDGRNVFAAGKRGRTPSLRIAIRDDAVSDWKPGLDQLRHHRGDDRSRRRAEPSTLTGD